MTNKIECGQVWKWNKSTNSFGVLTRVYSSGTEVDLGNKTMYVYSLLEDWTLHRHADGTLAESKPDQETGLSERIKKSVESGVSKLTTDMLMAELRKRIDNAPAQPERVCVWKPNALGESTGCGHTTIAGDRTEGATHCCFCGSRLEVKDA